MIGRKCTWCSLASRWGGGRDTEKQPEGYWGINKRAVNADLGDESEY